MQRPCGLQSHPITPGTAASPTSAGVIFSQSPPNTHTHHPPARHPITSTTHEAVISSLRGSQSRPHPIQSSPWHVLPDWLRKPVQTALTVWVSAGFFSAEASCDFPRHVNRAWSRQLFDCTGRWVTHLMPWHWKIRGSRKQAMAHWENRGNLLTVTFLLNVAWKSRINSNAAPEWKMAPTRPTSVSS